AIIAGLSGSGCAARFFSTGFGAIGVGESRARGSSRGAGAASCFPFLRLFFTLETPRCLCLPFGDACAKKLMRPRNLLEKLTGRKKHVISRVTAIATDPRPFIQKQRCSLLTQRKMTLSPHAFDSAWCSWC